MFSFDPVDYPETAKATLAFQLHLEQFIETELKVDRAAPETVQALAHLLLSKRYLLQAAELVVPEIRLRRTNTSGHSSQMTVLLQHLTKTERVLMALPKPTPRTQLFYSIYYAECQARWKTLIPNPDEETKKDIEVLIALQGKIGGTSSCIPETADTDMI